MIANQPRTNAILAYHHSDDFSDKEGYVVQIATQGAVGSLSLYSVSDTSVPFGVITHGGTEESSVAILGGGVAGTVLMSIESGTVQAGQQLELVNGGQVKLDTGNNPRILLAVALEAGEADDLIECAIFNPVSTT
jgi:hypothetical protein